MVEITIVVTESLFLLLEPDHKIRNVAKLMAWASLASLEQMRRNLENPDCVTFVWRKVDERDQWQLTVMIANSQDCINLIVKHLKNMEISVGKNYEKKKKIMESEVTNKAMKKINIDEIVQHV